jgi:5'-nucleotidase
LSGYVTALRAVRVHDGAVLLVDAGDMWQGTLASNLSEGKSVVEAYNALGYAAAAVGNHEFDFGPPGPKAIPESDSDDPRGALRQRASEANFPLLAANLIDEKTGRIVQWDNVRPSTMVTVGSVDIGIVGVVTTHALQTTIAANTVGLRVASLAESIIREARALRGQGAELVIVLAHAGGRCETFDDPHDLTACDLSGEILQVAGDIPPGLVDHIVGGHVHDGIAHVVNGIAITASYSKTVAFSRVDFTLDANSGAVIERRVFPPQPNRPTDSYEGAPTEPVAELVAIADAARKAAAQQQQEKLGVYLDTPMTLRSGPESELGNLMTDAVREFTNADIAIHNVRGGIRAELPAGELTYGSVFRMFPFDNRIAVIELSGAELRGIIARQVHNAGRRAGFSGMRAFVGCDDNGMDITLLLPDGRELGDDDIVSVAANDFLLLGGDDVLTPAIPPQGFDVPTDTPLVRDALLQWFRARGGHLHAGEFLDDERPRWNLPAELPDSCAYGAM